VIVAAALAAVAVAAGPVPLLDAPGAQDVAVAGEEVLVSRAGPHGSAVVHALPVSGGLARRLLAARAPGPGWRAQTFLSASPQRVAALTWYMKGTGHLPAIKFQQRLYTGPRAGPLRRVPLQRRWEPVDVAVDGDRVAVIEQRDGRLERSRVRVLSAGTWRTVRWNGGSAFPPIALAGERVAFVVPSQQRIVVAAVATGRRTAAVRDPGAPMLDLAPDGHVVVSGGLDGLYTAPPRRQLPGSRSLFNPRLAGPAVAAIERVGNEADSRPAVLDPGATAPRPVGVVSQSVEMLDADAQGLAWVANGCVLYAPVGATAPAEPPAGPCPRAEAAISRWPFTLHGRTLRFEVRCVAATSSGCTGATTLRLRHHGFAGRGAFHLAAGTERAFTVRLTRRAARFVRRRVRAGQSVTLPMRTRIADGRVSAGDVPVVIERVRR
jgi:hypothetical protein